MPKNVQFPGGPEESEDAKVGLDRQVRVDTTRKELRLHDGVTPGGFRILGKAGVEQLIAASAEDAQGQLTLISDNAALQALVPEANMYAVVVAAGQEAGYFWRPGVGDAGTIASSHTGHWRRLDAQEDTAIRLWRAGLINLQIEGSEPGSDQAVTPWLNSGSLKLWDGAAYVAATQVLFGRLLLQGNGGSGSGLDADLLDGQHAAAFLQLTGGTLTGTLGVPAGALATPAIHISGDTDTGLYSPGANQLDISVGGVKALGIDSSGIVVKPKVPAFTVSQTGWTISGASPYFIGDAARGAVVIELNNGSHFSTTLGKFTAPVDGIYAFTGSFHQNTGAGANPYMYLMKNGTSIGSITYNYYNIHMRVSVTARTFCSVGDYIQAGVYRDTISINNPTFSGHLIG